MLIYLIYITAIYGIYIIMVEIYLEVMSITKIFEYYIKCKSNTITTFPSPPQCSPNSSTCTDTAQLHTIATLYSLLVHTTCCTQSLNRSPSHSGSQPQNTNIHVPTSPHTSAYIKSLLTSLPHFLQLSSTQLPHYLLLPTTAMGLLLNPLLLAALAGIMCASWTLTEGHSLQHLFLL